jgi:hypothetical protein
MDRRAKLLGMEAVNIHVMTDVAESSPARAQLADASDGPAAVDAFDPEVEARRLIELMSQAGVLPPETSRMLLAGEPPDEITDDNIEDAILIENEVLTPDEVFYE